MFKTVVADSVIMHGHNREKQYQLTAQKHNEDALKFQRFHIAAQYFVRECEVAKHYDSWNTKDLRSEKYLEQSKKDEQLRAKKDRLRELLNEEENTYRKELESKNSGLKCQRLQNTAISLFCRKRQENSMRCNISQKNVYDVCRHVCSYYTKFSRYYEKLEAQLVIFPKSLIPWLRKNTLQYDKKNSTKPEPNELDDDGQSSTTRSHCCFSTTQLTAESQLYLVWLPIDGTTCKIS